MWNFVGKVVSLLFNMLSGFVIAFLPRSKHLLISWLLSPSAVILEPKKICYCFHFFPLFFICVLSRFSCVWLFVTHGLVAHQAPLSMVFSRQEYWSGLPLPFLGDLLDPGIKPRSPALQVDSLSSEPAGPVGPQDTSKWGTTMQPLILITWKTKLKKNKNKKLLIWY